MWGVGYVCRCVGLGMCVGVCMCGCFVLRVLVFTVFCIVCTVIFYCFVYVYLFLFATTLRTTDNE